MRYFFLLLLLIPFISFGQHKAGFEVAKVANYNQPIQMVCYSDGVDTLQGWKTIAIDPLGVVTPTIISKDNIVIPSAIEIDAECCNDKVKPITAKCIEICFEHMGTDYTGYENIFYYSDGTKSVSTVEDITGTVVLIPGVDAYSKKACPGSGLRDTIVINGVDTVYSIDTLLIKDTLVISNNDTIYSIDTLLIKDTLVINTFDTLLIKDTLVITSFDTLVIKDTLVINGIDTIYSFDTLTIFDTLLIKDTLVILDTLLIKDTLVILDSLIIKDTLFISGGVGKVKTYGFHWRVSDSRPFNDEFDIDLTSQNIWTSNWASDRFAHSYLEDAVANVEICIMYSNAGSAADLYIQEVTDLNFNYSASPITTNVATISMASNTNGTACTTATLQPNTILYYHVDQSGTPTASSDVRIAGVEIKF